MTGVNGTKHGVNANTAAAIAAVDYVAYPHYLTTLEQTNSTLNTAYLVTWTPMLGASAVPAHHDGVPQGDRVLPAPPTDIADSLVVFLPFDGNTLDTSGRANHAVVGPDSDFDPTLLTNDGHCGGFVRIEDFGGGATDASYLTLGSPADLNFATTTSFTIATWFRATTDQVGDPVIIGNKNWASGMNKGARWANAHRRAFGMRSSPMVAVS